LYWRKETLRGGEGREAGHLAWVEGGSDKGGEGSCPIEKVGKGMGGMKKSAEEEGSGGTLQKNGQKRSS